MADSSNSGGWRNLGVLAVGTLVGIVLGRMGAPVAAQRLGMLRTSNAGGDVFDDLAADHRVVLHVLDEMLESTSGLSRTRLFLRLKRNLSKHALAEEDVVYPLLLERTGASEDVRRLFSEHAEMKIALAKLEQLLESGTDWNAEVRALRDSIARHTQEEETVEFPRLRQTLDERQFALTAGKVYREKALLI